MPTVQSSIRVAASAQRVFDLTQDYYLRPAWDPFVRDIQLLDGALEPAVGVRVWVRAWTGITMEVEYSSFKPPELAAVKMTRGPAFLSSFAGAWRFHSVALNEADVEFIYSYRTRCRGFRPVFDPLIGAVFGRDIRRRLQGLKDEIEEGTLD